MKEIAIEILKSDLTKNAKCNNKYSYSASAIKSY
jgi:hypothetical protein